jgi:hypothetical protein
MDDKLKDLLLKLAEATTQSIPKLYADACQSIMVESAGSLLVIVIVISTFLYSLKSLVKTARAFDDDGVSDLVRFIALVILCAASMLGTIIGITMVPEHISCLVNPSGCVVRWMILRH